ncbi:hypothetical protein D7Z54_34095 [Salibacterium salarium]|uniref:Uncharacterized protein n=1 Tax=Salibacterium salarium TaxID=284579 RepID=A0A428MS19_9BACI|nr:hypothetical protein D7Z54_34095 [Salibacterium salarium]
MAYPREEQETVLVYDKVNDEWDAYSTVPKHIRKFQSIAGDFDFLERDARDNPERARCRLSPKQVSLRKERQMTDEQRQALSERMRKTRT